MNDDTWLRHATNIVAVLKEACDTYWDGREAIRILREADFHWRQMEWLGWYFEFVARECLKKRIGGTIGPVFGNTRFDYMHDGHVWDLKAHPSNGSTPWLILNDCEAIDNCIQVHGGIGFIIATGPATFDCDGAFKQWHDREKGGISKYERERQRRGAPSRRRKTAFQVERYRAFWWLSIDDIAKGRRDGWLANFQAGMRNADGSPRRAKYKVNLDRAPIHTL